MIFSRRQNLTSQAPRDDELTQPAIFSGEDFSHFYQWLCLNEEGITWQGQYYEEFHDFWNTLFIKDSSLPQLISRFEFISQETTKGPLYTWFQWLRNRLIIYSFIYKRLSISEIFKQTGLAPLKIAFFIRHFYIDSFPLLTEQIDNCLDSRNIHSSTTTVDINFMEKTLSIPKDAKRNKQQDAISSLEVTLYPQWRKLLKKIKTQFTTTNLDMQQIQRKHSLHTAVKFIKEIAILLCLSIILVFALRWANEIYRNHILEKIRISEPQFNWIDQDLNSKDEAQKEIEKKEIMNRLSQLDEVLSLQQKDDLPLEERFETESDVIISSLDNSTMEFINEDTQQGTRLNFRSYRFGYNRVYRVIIQSTHPDYLKKKFSLMFKQYGINHAEKTKPGMPVPGGFYYNLHVPIKYLKEFLNQILEEQNATFYETKTRGKTLPNKSRVFIFIKSV